MPRLIFLSLLVLAAACCCAQVTITPQGTATTPGVAVPATPVSPPILYAPSVHLNDGVAEIENPARQAGQTSAVSAEAPPFNFGMAQFGTSASAGGVGETIDGKSLAEVAQEMRRQTGSTTTNARKFTNSDVEALTGHRTNANSDSTDGWTANNGVITTEPPPNAIAAPSPQLRSPFAPPQNVTSDELDSAQAAARANSPAGVEIAQNEQPTTAQDAANPPGTYSYPRSSRLPQTATRLPLLGVLGLLTICAGFFVRQQRARAR